MPQLQVIQNLRGPKPPEQPNQAQQNLETFLSTMASRYRQNQDKTEIDRILGEYQQNQNDANAYQNAQLNLERADISPSKRLELQKRLNEDKKILIDEQKAIHQQIKKIGMSAKEQEEEYKNLIDSGWPEYAAKQYINAPPGVKQTLQREHSELVARGLRNPVKQSSQNPQDIVEVNPQTGEAVLNNTPIEEDEWPTPITPPEMTPAERVKWGNANEKTNNKELKETQEKKKALKTNSLLINSMTKVNESKKLPSGLTSVIIDPKSGDLRPEAQLTGLVNPETELYVKNLKQFLKGAKDFFGARVTNFDVTSFMAQLPSLLNTEQGRRLILKQMQYVNELESAHNDTLNETLKHYGRNANYNQISQVADEKISKKEQVLIDRINNTMEAGKELEKMSKNPELFKDRILMMNPKGEFKAVPKDKVEEKKSLDWVEY